MSQPFLGQITVFAGNFAPVGWAFCDGREMPISENEALFSILGTTYGGDGMTTFALPNLCDRVPVGIGQGKGTNPMMLGEEWNGQALALSGAGQQGQDTPGNLTINYIIALYGIYPSRD